MKKFLTKGFSNFRKASCIVIGDEILNGSVVDTNSNYLANFLSRSGVELCEVRTIPDEIEIISSSIKSFYNEMDYIFTSGGIGSTHDDITYEAIATCFDLDLHYDERILKKMNEFVPDEYINEALMSMALIPEGGDTYFVDDLFSPMVVVENVYILPGIPKLFRLMLERNKELFYNENTVYFTSEVFTNLGESRFANDLKEIQERYKSQNITIGSYPNSKKYVSQSTKINKKVRCEYNVKISIRGCNEKLVKTVSNEVIEVSEGWIIENN